MIVRSIDVNNDWNFGKGKQDYLVEGAAIGQSIKTRLQSFLGDCFFDIGAGIDWWNLLGSKNLVGLSLSIQTTIRNTDGVTRLVELSNVLDQNRKVTINYSASTIYTTLEPITSSVGVPV